MTGLKAGRSAPHGFKVAQSDVVEDDALQLLLLESLQRVERHRRQQPACRRTARGDDVTIAAASTPSLLVKPRLSE